MTYELPSPDKHGSGLSRLDQDLIRYAADNKTPHEMEVLTNIPAAQCAMRVQQILESRDWLSEKEREWLLIDDLYQLKSMLQRQVEANLDPSDASNLIRLLRLLGERIERQSRNIHEEADAIVKAQANELMRLLVAGFDAAKKRLEELYPEVDIQIIDAAFREGLAIASTE